MTDLPIPTEHAKQRACDLANALDSDSLRKPEMVKPFNGSLYLAAQLLTKYEPEPVDPGGESEKSSEFAWLIEAPGQSYLCSVSLGTSHYFNWRSDHSKALRFHSYDQAGAVMMAVRQLDRNLFAFEANLGDAKAVEHGWLAAYKAGKAATTPKEPPAVSLEDRAEGILAARTVRLMTPASAVTQTRANLAKAVELLNAIRPDPDYETREQYYAFLAKHKEQTDEQ